MAATAVVQITGTVFGLPEGGTKVLGPLTLVNVTSPAKEDTITLAGGTNTLTLPTGTRLVLIIPPTGNVTTISLKGLTSDVGVQLDPGVPSLVAVPASLLTLVLTAQTNIIGVRVLYL